MIPRLIQKRGAQHLADEDALAESSPSVPPIIVPQSVVELVPAVIARENLVFPLRFEGGRTLHIATIDPTNILLRDKLSFMLNKDIRLVNMQRDQILLLINYHYFRTRTESVSSMLMAAPRDRARYDADKDEEDELYDQPYDGTPGTTRSGAISQRVRSMPRFLARSLVDSKKSLNGIEAGRLVLGEHTEQDADELGAPQLGEERAPNYGRYGMWYYTVEEGQRALMIRKDGRMEVIIGPARVWHGSNRFERMRHFVAHPGDFLVVRFRDGRQDHIAGPADVWFDPRVHESITRQEALQLAAKEAVVVYAKAAENQPITRRLVYGPTQFVPAPGEWLHTFSWHGADGGSQGQRKVANGLVFQKLWLMPDQMYHDVTDVRTADDAVLTIKLMMFFELLDIERMLETTHDPIGDFINAATSDVVDFIGHRTFEEFKKETGKLNELETYRQLTARAAQNGYRINKVVYRGYGAPDRLQAMHDQAIEARTKLQLERVTEEQSQSLEDFKLTAQMNRASRRRTEQAIEVETEIELARKRQEAERNNREAERNAQREQHRRDAESEQELRRQADDRQRAHLAALKEMGVDLTALLTQGRADRVIELRGGKGISPHLHLDNANGETS